MVCVGIPGQPTPLSLDAREIIAKDLKIFAGGVVCTPFHHLSVFNIHHFIVNHLFYFILFIYLV